MKTWLIGGAVALGGLALIADDLGSLLLGAAVGAGATAAASLRKKGTCP